MLKIITGKPGSGKSYYAVKTIIDNCRYDPISETYTLKEGIFLVATLEGLRLNFVDFDQTIKELAENETDLKKFPSETEESHRNRNGLYQFFSVPLWQNEIAPKWQKILIVIDEAQRYFPASARDIPNSVWYWFEYHRHFGADIVLMTQHPSSLHRRVLNIAENYIEAAPPGLRQVKNLLRYSLRDTTTNEIISQSSQRTEPQVFKAYKSATHAQGIKPPPNHLTKIYALGGVLAAAVVIGIITMYTGLMNHFQKEKQLNQPPTAAAKSWPKETKPTATHQPDNKPAPTGQQTATNELDFTPAIPGRPETAPAYRHLLQVKSAPTLAGCIKTKTACKCYTQQATPYPVTWEQCLEHVANIHFNPYAEPSTSNSHPTPTTPQTPPAPVISPQIPITEPNPT